MPIYQIRCADCKFMLEKYFPTLEEYSRFLNEEKCPDCDGVRLYRGVETTGYRRDHTVLS